MRQEEIEQKIKAQKEKIAKRQIAVAKSFGGKDDNLRSNVKKLQALESTLERYYVQLENVKATEVKLNNLPNSIKAFRDNLVKACDEEDMLSKEEAQRKYTQLRAAMKEFDVRDEKWEVLSTEMQKLQKSRGYELMDKSDEKIHDENVNYANGLILDLWDRVVKICGVITETKGMVIAQGTNGYACLNGKVEGEKGSAFVESIVAGGYNIQKLHIRVLLKEIQSDTFKGFAPLIRKF